MVVVDFLKNHYGDVAAAMVALATLGSIVARFTKTDKDDKIFAKALEYLRRLPSFGLDPAHKAETKTKTDA